MAVANWSSRYETGIGIIDAQHQALFAAVNRLAASFTAGHSGTEVTECLAFLLAYTVEHFQTEEQYLRERGYPGLALHVALHQQLMQETRDLQARHQAGRLVTIDVAIFLAEWLMHHIDEADMEYVSFTRTQNQQSAPG